MIKCRTGVIPVGAGSVHPARAYFLHDQNCHTFAEALKRPIWLSWTEYAESNRAGEVEGCEGGKVESDYRVQSTECGVTSA